MPLALALLYQVYPVPFTGTKEQPISLCFNIILPFNVPTMANNYFLFLQIKIPKMTITFIYIFLLKQLFEFSEVLELLTFIIIDIHFQEILRNFYTS